MLRNSHEGSRFSRPITRIAVASVALGVCVMILSVSIVRGFQSEIRDKVIGFGSHIQIIHRAANNSYESLPVDIAPDFLKEVEGQPGVKHIQPFAIKPAILQVRRKTADTTRKNENEILGVICKGINKDFDWGFIESHLKSGEVLSFPSKKERNELVLSQNIANKLKLNVNDSLYLFLVVAEGPKPYKFFVKGIYESGLSDFDDQFVFIDMIHIQKINDWGVEGFASIGYKDDNRFVVNTLVTGSNIYRKYQWNKKIPTDQDSLILPLKDTTIQLVVFDQIKDENSHEWLINFEPDTISIKIEYDKKAYAEKNDDPEFPIVSAPSESQTVYQYENDQIILTQKNTGGSYKYFAGGFEVLLNNWDDLLNSESLLADVVPYDYSVKPITDIYAEIFDWLILLDTNVKIIILLMLLVCLINMASTLLVIILERTAMIGTLKALGCSNRSIGKIFIYNASYYIIQGLFWGNLLAIGLGILQQQTGFIGLDQNTYFMATVPVQLDLWYILAIDLGTLVICTLAMFLPSMLISKISPVKAIRFK